ncbi:hypothetical protein [Dictyobacter kobayashii]|nr:hypothetical protein [Dictyobacter kobayashii]
MTTAAFSSASNSNSGSNNNIIIITLPVSNSNYEHAQEAKDVSDLSIMSHVSPDTWDDVEAVPERRVTSKQAEYGMDGEPCFMAASEQPEFLEAPTEDFERTNKQKIAAEANSEYAVPDRKRGRDPKTAERQRIDALLAESRRPAPSRWDRGKDDPAPYRPRLS